MYLYQIILLQLYTRTPITHILTDTWYCQIFKFLPIQRVYMVCYYDFNLQVFDFWTSHWVSFVKCLFKYTYVQYCFSIGLCGFFLFVCVLHMCWIYMCAYIYIWPVIYTCHKCHELLWPCFLTLHVLVNRVHFHFFQAMKVKDSTSIFNFLYHYRRILQVGTWNPSYPSICYILRIVKKGCYGDHYLYGTSIKS